VKANQATYPVRAMCRVLQVSHSGYYAWLKRGPSARSCEDARLTRIIQEAHRRSGCSYGAPRIRWELALEHGCAVGQKRVARLMCAAGLRGITRRRYVRTTRADAYATPAADQVQRAFQASSVNRLWVADFTYIPTGTQWLYLAIVLDVYSRRVVGWSMRKDMTAALVMDALRMALWRRPGRGLIHHSDHGTQYSCEDFRRLCAAHGVSISMGSAGDAYDNAMAESFFATLKCELIHRRRFATPTEARNEIFGYIEGWYNRHRRHSALNYLSPMEYEKRMAHTQPASS
jgi:putative transposase